MEEGEDDTRRIVRIYSYHAEDRLPPPSDAHVLARVLSNEEPSLEDILEPWRRFYKPWELNESERDPITDVLSIEAAKLQKKWHEFQKTSPPDDRVNIKTSEPTMKGIISMVTSVGKTWEEKHDKGKRAKAMRCFHQFCGTLDSHKSILEVVPRSNEYVSLFAGSITTIIKASVNHEQIAEELAQALSILSEHIAECEIELEIFKTEGMMRAVADLYAHIFLFLSDVMDWYMKKRRKRLMDSFNERFLQDFENVIENIRRKSELVMRKAAQNSRAEMRVTRINVEETRKDMRLGLEGVMRETAETRYHVEHLSDQLRRERAERREKDKHVGILYEQLMKFLTHETEAHQSQDINRLLVETVGSRSRRVSDISSMYDTRITREEVLVDSAHLEAYFYRDRVRIPSDLFTSQMVDPEALARIAEWTMPDQSQLLCIAGPVYEGDELENPTTMLAAKFIEFAANSGVQIISYFCELRRGKKRRNEHTREMEGLIELLHGLMRQVIELIPAAFDGDKDLSPERFERLDGTVDSWSDSIALFRDVLDILPTSIFCIIDGIQWLDDRSTNDYLKDLIEVLRITKLKVLFTTSGQPRCLMECLSRTEMLCADGPLNRSVSSLTRFEEAVIHF